MDGDRRSNSYILIDARFLFDFTIDIQLTFINKVVPTSSSRKSTCSFWLPKILTVPKYSWGWVQDSRQKTKSVDAQVPYIIKWWRAMHKVGPQYLRTPHHRWERIQVFIFKTAYQWTCIVPTHVAKGLIVFEMEDTVWTSRRSRDCGTMD